MRSNWPIHVTSGFGKAIVVLPDGSVLLNASTMQIRDTQTYPTGPALDDYFAVTLVQHNLATLFVEADQLKDVIESGDFLLQSDAVKSLMIEMTEKFRTIMWGGVLPKNVDEAWKMVENGTFQVPIEAEVDDENIP